MDLYISTYCRETLKKNPEMTFKDLLEKLNNEVISTENTKDPEKYIEHISRIYKYFIENKNKY
jgi:hypothetical protein